MGNRILLIFLACLPILLSAQETDSLEIKVFNINNFQEIGLAYDLIISDHEKNIVKEYHSILSSIDLPKKLIPEAGIFQIYIGGKEYSYSYIHNALIESNFYELWVNLDSTSLYPGDFYFDDYVSKYRGNDDVCFSANETAGYPFFLYQGKIKNPPIEFHGQIDSLNFQVTIDSFMNSKIHIQHSTNEYLISGFNEIQNDNVVLFDFNIPMHLESFFKRLVFIRKEDSLVVDDIQTIEVYEYKIHNSNIVKSKIGELKRD